MDVATLDMEVAEETEHVAGVSNTVVTYINSETGEEVFPDMGQFVEDTEGQETIGVYQQESEEVHEGYQQVAEGEYQEAEAVTSSGQDLVSLAMETSKVTSESQEIPEATESLGRRRLLTRITLTRSSVSWSRRASSSEARFRPSTSSCVTSVRDSSGQRTFSGTTSRQSTRGEPTEGCRSRAR